MLDNRLIFSTSFMSKKFVHFLMAWKYFIRFDDINSGDGYLIVYSYKNYITFLVLSFLCLNEWMNLGCQLPPIRKKATNLLKVVVPTHADWCHSNSRKYHILLSLDRSHDLDTQKLFSMITWGKMDGWLDRNETVLIRTNQHRFPVVTKLWFSDREIKHWNLNKNKLNTYRYTY